MITLFIRNHKDIGVKMEGCSYNVFGATVSILKRLGGRYSPSDKTWIYAPYKYDSLLDALDEVDTLDNQIDSFELQELLAGKQELETEKVRRIPDYSLLNYPPIKGKAPHENFQRDAIAKSINVNRRAEFLGMGSGKSYIAAAIIAHRYLKYKDCGKVVFLTTSIGVRNLYHELLKFIKDLDRSKIAVIDKHNRNAFDNKDIDIIITSYNTFRLTCDYYKKQYKITSTSPRKPFLPLKEWSDDKELMLILDESHNVANPKSQQGYLVSLHAKLFKYRYLFSGTPADKVEKIYNQYKILDDYLVWGLSYNDWKEKMAYIGDRFSAYSIREWKKDELEKQNQRFTSQYGEYFKTTDLVDLPDYNEKRIYIPMSQDHRSIYETFIMKDLEHRKNVREIVNSFPYMCLAVDNPPLLMKHEEKFSDDFNKMLSKFKVKSLEKLNAIEDIVSDHPGEKIIIWAIHPATINMIGEHFKKCKPICITGATPQDERFELVEEFKRGDHQLLIANIACLNTSVTILEAKVQIYAERGYSYSQYEQSTQRAYRIGQDKDVTSYILIYDKSLDVLVDKNLSSKGTLVDGLCSKDFLSQEEWIKIFNATEKDNFEETEDIVGNLGF